MRISAIKMRSFNGGERSEEGERREIWIKKITTVRDSATPVGRGAGPSFGRVIGA
jgi:hypothetical protein